MPTFVDRSELLRSIVERVVRRCLVLDANALEPAEREAIEADAARRGVTFSAAHAVRRHDARATLTRIEAARAAVDIADAVIAAEHSGDALVYRVPNRRASLGPDRPARVDR